MQRDKAPIDLKRCASDSRTYVRSPVDLHIIYLKEIVPKLLLLLGYFGTCQTSDALKSDVLEERSLS